MYITPNNFMHTALEPSAELIEKLFLVNRNASATIRSFLIHSTHLERSTLRCTLCAGRKPANQFQQDEIDRTGPGQSRESLRYFVYGQRASSVS